MTDVSTNISTDAWVAAPYKIHDRWIEYLVSQGEKEYDKLAEADILYPVSHSS